MAEFQAAVERVEAATSAAADALWQVRLLEGFVLDDREQQLTRLRTRAAVLLLARLAMASARAHGREELAALLLPDADAAASRSRLRQTLSYLKSLLEPPGGAIVAGPLGRNSAATLTARSSPQAVTSSAAASRSRAMANASSPPARTTAWHASTR